MKKVNLIEAIKSGKRFKPVNQDDHGWMYVDVDDHGDKYVYWNGAKQFLNLEYLDDEFELEEKKIEISESEFDEAVRSSLNYCQENYKEFYYLPDSQIKQLKKELGF